MPKLAHSVDNKRWLQAVEAVEGFLYNSDLTPGIRLLTESELRKYKLRQVQKGWRFGVDFGSEVIAFDLLISLNFPWRPPKVALAQLNKALIWPHVEDDGVLCLHAEIDEVDVNAPIASVKQTLAKAITLIQECLEKTNQEDFQNEFQAYWGRSVSEKKPVLSLISPQHSICQIKVWHSTQNIIVSDTEASIRSWMQNKQGSDPCETFKDGLLIPFSRPLLPKEYPKDSMQFMRLAKAAGAEKELVNLIQHSPESIIVVFTMQTSNGVAMAAIKIIPPATKRIAGKVLSGNPLTKGFRPTNISSELLVQRYLHGHLERLTVQRIDSSWVHCRDSNPIHSFLHNKRVAIIGCGSLGSLVAAQLAAAGIGKFLLVDNDNMKWENVGRHHLGAQHVGLNKALALSEILRRDYPHIQSIDFHPYTWEYLKGEEIFQSCDLVISAIGSWGSESLLNEWHIISGRTQPIIYAWLEPYALVAHALAILANGGCFACQLTSHGTPKFQVINWKNSTVKQQPACGAFFQPYGSIELTEASTLVSKMALDALLGKLEGSVAHTWIGRMKAIENMECTLNPEWQSKMDLRPNGEFTHVWNYTCNDDCVWCAKL